MATKRQRRKRRKRRGSDGGVDGSAEPVAGASEPLAGATGSTGSATEPSAVAADDARRARVARRRGAKGRPPPPWGSFPLSELVILVAIVLLFAGFFFVPPPRGGVMLGVGLGLGCLAGLELAIREHFAGYRSHNLLLGGAAGVAVVGGLFALGPDSLPLAAAVGIGAVVFAAASYGFAVAFRRRSGGALFRSRA